MTARPIKRMIDQWEPCSVEEATHVELHFPIDIHVTVDLNPPYTYYPLTKRIIPIQLTGSRADTNNWSWNGDTERPTLRPSILTEVNYGGVLYRCHSFVNDGVVQFLEDCSHELRGKSIPLEKISRASY